jgi:type 1 fimbriae regulatory protein FimB
LALDAFQRAKLNALDFKPMSYMVEYLTQLESEKRNKDYIRTVRNGLAHFADFMRTENVLHPEEITRLHLVRFQGLCNERDWSPAYRIQILKKVRAWLNWLEEVGYIENNPWIRIKVGTIPKKPKPLSDDEVEQLFLTHRQGAFTMTPFAFHRREIILCLLYGWGLRIHELEALNVTDMDVRKEFVTVRNKGGGSKTEPYSPRTKQVFQRWTAARARNAIPTEDALLITSQGTRLDKDDIYRIVVDLGKAAGIAINPHRLRDTCGTNLLDSDVPAERVQQILGHSNLKQTLAYSRVNNKKVAESHEAAMDPRLSRLLFSNTKDLVP